MFSIARPGPEDLRRPWGGVLALVRLDIPASMQDNLSSTDIMVLKVGPFLLYNAYLLPANSTSWKEFTRSHPFDMLCQSLAAAVLLNCPIIIFSDANGRTNSQQPFGSLARQSPDMASACPRGKDILKLCSDHNLTILNGVAAFGSSSDKYTSYQPRGCSVIDYAIVDQGMLPNVCAFAVGTHEPEWSDHAPIAVKLAIPGLEPSAGPLHGKIQRLHSSPAQFHLPSESELDCMLIEVVNSIKRPADDPILRVYGCLAPDSPRSSTPISAYISGTCILSQSTLATGAGIAYGQNSSLNISFRVHGPGLSENCAAAYAALYAIAKCPANRPLIIVSKSEYVISALSHFALSHMKRNWNTANGDVLRAITTIIRARSALTHLSLLDPRSQNNHFLLALSLAELGCSSSATFPLPIAQNQPFQAPTSSGLPKVTTDMPNPLQEAPASGPTKTDLPSHRGRSQMLRRRDMHLHDFQAAANNSALFWKKFVVLAQGKTADQPVPIDQLKKTFQERMNAPSSLPELFDATLHARYVEEANSIPLHTADKTPDQLFDTPFSDGNIEDAKVEIDKHPTNSASGIEQIHYRDIIAMDTQLLCKLINEAIRSSDSPSVWIISIIIGILKKGKSPGDPNNYRTIVLESCMLKFVTLLIMRRIVKYADLHKIVPPSQNGFRKHFRTNNNAFILRCAIERAKSLKKTLYVATIDLSNAFPSTDCSTLWVKLLQRHGDLSDPFSSNTGILIGDTLSPELFIIYFADWDIPWSDDDIALAGMFISHLEQADDVLLLALSPEGLQRKMTLFYIWCCVNFFTINAIKSGVSYHGPVSPSLPVFKFGNDLVAIVDSYKYVGMLFRTGDYRVFSSIMSLYYADKAAKARSTAHAVLHIESMIGSLPVSEGKTLYMGCIDPHLIYGCEIAIDTSTNTARPIYDIQLSFFRRLLGLSKTSITAAVFSETGIMPLSFRRLILAMRFLAYCLSRPSDSYVRSALNDSINLHVTGFKSWFGDLITTIKCLCPSYSLPHHSILLAARDATSLGDFSKEITTTSISWIESELERVVKRSYILRLRKEPLQNGSLKYYTSRLRAYLGEIHNSFHRKTMTRVLSGDHPLAVVRLTWTDNHRSLVPHDQRLCRLCKFNIETPEHVLLECSDPVLMDLRSAFFTCFYDTQPNPQVLRFNTNTIHYLAYLASCRPIFPILAKWMTESIRHIERTPLHIPSQYRR
ncbi:hypothetical protein D9757_006858 [Collybiopsis confluens]|uniref:Reverse transcriptase domain-containing protein n=1 Tax=Collybiopsis confluens TaxID=2823264 RepID=A0A8H5HQ63_9AGAR|nr:hypothetical protein D9757_006858 [Collybiopsis confluens]